jgi:uncharacterized membrane protein HdeD (DUF308 family)
MISHSPGPSMNGEREGSHMTEPSGSRGAASSAGTARYGGQAGQPAGAAAGGASASGEKADVSGGSRPAGRARFWQDDLAGRFSHLWLVLLVAAVAMVAVGIIMLVWPAETLLVFAVLIGAALLVAGLLRLVEGFTARAESGGMRVADVVIGLLAIVVGLYCLKHHDLTLVFVAFVVGVFWVVQGITDISIAIASGPMPGRWLMAVAGVFSVVAGVLVTFWPGISLLLMLWFLGVWLIVYGVILVGRALALRSELKSLSGRASLGHA